MGRRFTPSNGFCDNPPTFLALSGWPTRFFLQTQVKFSMLQKLSTRDIPITELQIWLYGEGDVDCKLAGVESFVGSYEAGLSEEEGVLVTSTDRSSRKNSPSTVDMKLAKVDSVGATNRCTVVLIKRCNFEGNGSNVITLLSHELALASCSTTTRSCLSLVSFCVSFFGGERVAQMELREHLLSSTTIFSSMRAAAANTVG